MVATVENSAQCKAEAAARNSETAENAAARKADTAAVAAGREVAAARRELVGEKLTSNMNKVDAPAEAEAQKLERNYFERLRRLKIGAKYYSEQHGACEVVGISGDRIRMAKRGPRFGAIEGYVQLPLAVGPHSRL